MYVIKVTAAVVSTVNNLMNVDEAQLEAAANEGATNMAVQSLESQLQFVNVSASNGTYIDVQPNLGVQVCLFILGRLLIYRCTHSFNLI